MRRKQIDPVLLEMLQRSRKRYSLVHGSSHLHLRVEGKLVLILPRRLSYSGRDVANSRADLKRALRRLQRRSENAGQSAGN